MSSSPSSHTSSASTSPLAADRLLRNQIQVAHVKQLWWILASIVAVLTIIRVFRHLWSRFIETRITSVDASSVDVQHDITPRRLTASIPYRIFASSITACRIILFRLNVPISPNSSVSVSELGFIFFYISLNLSLLFVNTRNLTPLFYQDRAALLASSQLPLIVALAGKNNLISWLTGVGHEKLNVFHRATSRTNFLLLWIHAIARIKSGLPSQFDFTHGWMVAGAISLACLTAAVILSLPPIRHAAFEIFLITHIILVFASLVAGYYHAKNFGMGYYIWPALFIWAFDRITRLVLLAWNNMMWNSKKTEDALVELLSEDTVRLTLRRNISWVPGQHAYVVLPAVSTLPFEAHPFTIASIPDPNGKDGASDVVFIIRGRNGFTRRLQQYASRANGSRVPALIDGPYGFPPDLRRFSTCVMIAGGSGISYTLPLLLHLIKLNGNGESSSVRKIVFVWVVRDLCHLEWLTEALGRATASLTIEPRIYITQQSKTPLNMAMNGTHSSINSTDIEKQSVTHQEHGTYNAFHLFFGRPDIKTLLLEQIESSSGTISVDVAGPSPLADSVRQALRTDLAGPSAVLKGSHPVTLHVEKFGI